MIYRGLGSMSRNPSFACPHQLRITMGFDVQLNEYCELATLPMPPARRAEKRRERDEETLRVIRIRSKHAFDRYRREFSPAN